MAESNKKPKPVSDAQRRKDELIAELARSRVGMSLHGGQVAYQADLGRRAKTSLKASFRHHIGAWLAGALVAGGAVSMLPMRERKVYVNPLSKGGKAKLEKARSQPPPQRGGFLISLIRALTPIIKPILTAFITKKLASLVQGAEGAQKAAERTTSEAEKATAQAQDTTADAAAVAR